MTYFVVYAPSVGYSLRHDTGKQFRFEVEAEHFVLELRKNGHYAWCESELCRPRDEYGL